MGKKREGFVLLVLDLNYLNHWETNLAKSFPNIKFTIFSSNPTKNNTCSGLIKIEAGDLLVSASTQGYAQSVQAVTPTSWQQVWNNLGSPFAKALEDCEQGTSVIRAWVM